MSHEGIWAEYRQPYRDEWRASNRLGDLVRCRDCKHASYYKDVLWCSELGGDDSMPVEPNDFCAWGSRK